MRGLILLLIPTLSFGATYRQVLDQKGVVSADIIQRVEDRAFIPIDKENKDYVAFLQWEKEGNKIFPPEPMKPEDEAQRVAFLKAMTDAQDVRKTPAERIDAILTIIGAAKPTASISRTTTR